MHWIGKGAVDRLDVDHHQYGADAENKSRSVISCTTYAVADTHRQNGEAICTDVEGRFRNMNRRAQEADEHCHDNRHQKQRRD